MKTSMKVEGLNELRLALRRLPVELQDRELARAASAGAKVIAAEAQVRAPVLKEPHASRVPGLLRRMIRGTAGKRRGTEAAAFVSIKYPSGKLAQRLSKAAGPGWRLLDPYYWRFVEFGTSHAKAQPFIRPAFDSKKEAAVAAIAEALRSGIARAAARVRGRKFP